MKCHYEVLGLEKDCGEGDIKKAYRKAALVWHPDKNQDRKEEAEEKFKEITNSYEVLSDPHERAWYDSHREAILRSGERHQAGADDIAGGQRPDNEPDLFQFFSGSAFSGYNDGPKGFYTVYSDIFAKLAEQEAGVNDKKQGEMPQFGLSSASASEVSIFYSYWSGFTTVKPFTWADQYNPASAPNRQIRRRMEEENKKARKIVKKEFVDTVRELVMFVKKRDKRLIAIQQAEAAKKAEREAAEALRRQQLKDEKQKKASTYVDADWIRDSEVAMDSSSGEEEEEVVEEFYCVVCEKSFKSAKQLLNHEGSKRHKHNLAELREALEEEEALLAAIQEEDSGDGSDGSESEEEAANDTIGHGGQEDDKDAAAVSDTDTEEGEEEDEDAMLARMVGASVSAAQRTEESEESEDEDEEDEEAILARMVGTSGSAARKVDDSDDEESEEEGEDGKEDEEAMLAGMVESSAGRPADGSDSGEESDEEATAAGEKAETNGTAQSTSQLAPKEESTSNEQRDAMLAEMLANSCKPLSGWQPNRPAETAAEGSDDPDKAASAGSEGLHSSAKPLAKEKGTNKTKGKAKGKGKGKGKAPEADHACSICHKVFDSRNQLFKHISTTGHAALRR